MIQNPITEKLLDDIISLISETSGMRFRETHKSGILRFLQKRTDELNLSYEEYIELLKTNEQENFTLINASTVNETYFFREENQFELVKKLIEKREKVSFWSAACSSGEEIYSLKLLCDSININADFFASDINTDKLEILKQGLYSYKHTTREIDGKKFHKLLESYKVDDAIQFPETIINKIESNRINLADLNSYKVLDGRKFDFIFLRNVFIYFSIDTRYKILNHIANNFLLDDGYIFVSLSETAQLEEKNLISDMEKISIDNIFVFHKKKTQEIEVNHG